MAAVGNFIGAHFGAEVAKTVGSGLVNLPTGVASLGIVFAGVIGAIVWNLITWYFGLPVVLLARADRRPGRRDARRLRRAVLWGGVVEQA